MKFSPWLLFSSTARFRKKLNSFWRDSYTIMQHRWDRSLPLGDYVVDRWEKARILGFGGGSSIYDSALVIGQVRVGRNTWVGPFTILDGSGGLEIGDDCAISAGVQIYTHDSIGRVVESGSQTVNRAPVKIGHRCYLGPNCVVSRGVVIGDGCIIGANSLVNRDLPPGVKAWGTPARVVAELSPEMSLDMAAGHQAKKNQ